MVSRPKPLVLLILDGFGIRQERENNAIALANTPCWDSLQREFPMTALDCSGDVVGLPGDQMGNSEVGHLHIGSGRLLRQELSRVSYEIEAGIFEQNPVLCEAVDQAIKKDKALHIMGLLSTGGVHSHEDHIMAMIELAAKRGLKKIYLHAFLDGRDVPPKSADSALQLAEDTFKKIGTGRIATVSGRFYAMDRDNRWERVEVAYKAIAKGEAQYTDTSARHALADSYARNETDEFVVPTLILDEQGQAAVLDQDSYPIAYPSEDVKNSIGEVVANLGMKQLRLAETEKYAHVTFFLNGGRDEPFSGEDRILVPSPKVKTYDLQPEMSAAEVTQHLVSAITGGQYDLIICNYANCDMVGHTGHLEAAIKAVETIDASLSQVVAAVQQVGGQMLITADHGNIEQMVDPTSGQAHTAHTTNLVPLVHVGGHQPLSEGGNLADLAPTMLKILNIPQPVEMTGRALLG
ncbi:MAG: 2,3-bisphosphoglycerate-independent phosphoglycerate mutase [Methylococcaceae bacterium]|nr:2,3-bisphosphoglycerate-independent phosphoglycerate mutase [Methylococcaceae bacterium]